MTALALVKQIERIATDLEKAKSLEEVLVLRDKLVALNALARVRKAGTKARADLWQMLALSERRTGELTVKLPQAAPGRKKSVSEGTDSPGPKPKSEVIRELGMTRAQVAKAEKLAAQPATEFNAKLAHGHQLITEGKPAPNLHSKSSGSGYDGDEYGTPAEYVEPARDFMAGIELDPFSNAAAQEIVKADRWHHKDNSSLDVEWHARSVWFQPPFSKVIKECTVKLIEEWTAGHIGECVGLTNLDPSTVWWKSIAAVSPGFVLVDRRISFLLNGVPYTENRFSQWFFYLGPRLEQFFEAHRQFGLPCRPDRRAA